MINETIAGPQFRYSKIQKVKFSENNNASLCKTR